jgi:hypothetical protein
MNEPEYSDADFFSGIATTLKLLGFLAIVAIVIWGVIAGVALPIFKAIF